VSAASLYYSGPVAVGDVYFDPTTDQYKMYDGSNWITLDAHDQRDVLEIQEHMKGRQNITESYLEKEYPDLKELKEAYNKLAEKYRVFEILKRDTT
jgi:hypothetical protein